MIFKMEYLNLLYDSHLASSFFVSCHLCWVPFLWGGILDKTALFVTLCQWTPFWPSTSVRYLRSRYLVISYSVISWTPICRTCLPRKKTITRLCLEIQFSANIKAYFFQQEIPSRMIQNDYVVNNQWFGVTCIILSNLQNTNLHTFLENSVLCYFK